MQSQWPRQEPEAFPEGLRSSVQRYRTFFQSASGPSPFRELSPKILIASTSRTGSNLLCRQLASSGLGIDEFFQPSQLLRFGLCDDKDFFAFVRQVSQRFSPVGAFGVKGTYQTLAPLFMFREFPDHLHEWDIVFLRRKNSIAQAVSLTIAELTGAWRSDMVRKIAPHELAFDHAHITKNLENIALINRRWAAFFASYGRSPIEVWYEDLAMRPEIVAGSIANQIGLSRQQGIGEKTFFGSSVLQSQSSSINAEWERRYRQSTGTLSGSESAKQIVDRNTVRRSSRYIHVLHIPKTGGTAIRSAISAVRDDTILLHRHKTRMVDLEPGEDVIFAVRHPLTRFASAFCSRQREGRPRYEVPWSADERAAFEQFSTPNALAEALFDPELEALAEFAMRVIAHVNKPLTHWVTAQELESRRADILYIARQEVLDQDFIRIKMLLGLSKDIRLPANHVEAHRMPGYCEASLSEKAKANLRRWFREDIKFYQQCAVKRKSIIEAMVTDRGANRG